MSCGAAAAAAAECRRRRARSASPGIPARRNPEHSDGLPAGLPRRYSTARPSGVTYSSDMSASVVPRNRESLPLARSTGWLGSALVTPDLHAVGDEEWAAL